MFNTKNWIYLGLIVAALAVFIPRSSAQTISCSSDDGKRHYCSANGSGRARLVNQHSESACTEGYSWGSDNRGIWVDHGCRADFAIEGERGGGDRDGDRNRDRDGDNNGYRRDNQRDRNRDGDNDGYRRDNQGSDQAQVISCSSDDMHRHYCQADTRGGVQLIRQHSEASCRQGRSWDFDRRGIWVDHGCRADFQVGR
jgi:hypothetical protein